MQSRFAASLQDYIRSIEPAIAAHGYRRRHALFGLRRGGDWSLIHIQGHKLADWQGEVTVNLAFSSATLRALLEDSTRGMPSDVYGHWRYRIGDLLPARTDTWWPMPLPDGGYPPEPLVAIEEYAIPTLARLFEPSALASELADNPDPFFPEEELGLVYGMAIAAAAGLARYEELRARARQAAAGDPSLMGLIRRVEETCFS